MKFRLDAAKSFVAEVDLTGTRRRPAIAMDAASDAGGVFDEVKKQAQIVGSGVFSFAVGVDAQVRQAISDSALLAQLVANKQVDFATSPVGWFTAYSRVLQNVGWTLQDTNFADYSAQGTAAEVNEKIAEVMAAILAPAPAALAIIKSTVDALKAMNPNSSWLTLFNRESAKANIARFQIGLVEKDPNADVFVSLVACVIEARSDITQVLFFKFRQAKATFKAVGEKVSVDRSALNDLAEAIRTKIRVYQTDYVSSIKDLG
jgi:hypothetical protein